MEAYLTHQILNALTSGDLPKLAAYVAIFIFLWVEVRGLKNEFKKLNDHLQKSLADGEARFEAIEATILRYEGRLTTLESIQGGRA